MTPEQARIVLFDVSAMRTPDESYHVYTAEMRAYWYEINDEWEQFKRLHPEITYHVLEVPGELEVGWVPGQ